jgi:hypothetical protein
MGTPKKYSRTAKENVNSCKEILDNDENLQSQADKDENEFNSAVCDVEVLDNDIRVRDDMLLYGLN